MLRMEIKTQANPVPIVLPDGSYYIIMRLNQKGIICND